MNAVHHTFFDAEAEKQRFFETGSANLFFVFLKKFFKVFCYAVHHFFYAMNAVHHNESQ